jgi:hypothetical protein
MSLARFSVEDCAGVWVWRLYDRSGHCVATSREYRSQIICRRSLADAVRVWFPEAVSNFMPPSARLRSRDT